MSKNKNYTVVICAGIGFLVIPINAFLRALTGSSVENFDVGLLFGFSVFLAVFGAIVGLIINEN